MTWWRRRRIRLPPSLEEQRKMREARQAVAAAEETLEQTKQRGAEVSKVAGLLRTLREDHFGGAVERSMQRRPQ